MQQAKMERLIHDQSTTAKNVLECVPALTTAATHEIMAAYRETGKSIAQRALDGCLAHLKDTGLIKEPTRGCYIRVTPSKPTLVLKKSTPEVTTPEEDAMPEEDDSPLDVTETPGQPRDPLEVIDDLRKQFEAAALEIEAYYEMREAEYKKKSKQLRHFKALMESLEDD